MRRLIWIAVCSATACVLWGSAAAAATLQPIGKFKQPISVTSDPSNPERLLIAEREGVVNEVTAGTVTQLADIRSLVSCCEVERGLLSIAPAPDFDSSGRFYVAYTGKPAAGGAEGDVHVDSFRPNPAGGQPLREPILEVEHSTNANHNGGQLQFGPDGHLYISLGDGGAGGDPPHNAQNTEVLLGKILRIDPRPGQTPAYAVPADNPFVGGPGRDEIWADGLRNPWRFSFDLLGGGMVIADVGQDAHEEVDWAPSPGNGVVSGGGDNYGWNCREGFSPYLSECASAPGFTEPVFDYPHTNPGDGSAHGCSIIGGYVVRDPGLGDLYGRYVYTDYCSEEIRSMLLPSTAAGLASGDRSEGLTIAKPTSFGEDSCGRVYVASDQGTVYRLTGTAPTVCLAPTGSGQGVSDSKGRELSQGPNRNQGRGLGLRLSAKRADSRLRIVVSASPCAGLAGERVQLNRGGKRLGVRRFDDNCTAHFQAPFKRASTFRALLPGSEMIRSRPLAVPPPLSRQQR